LDYWHAYSSPEEIARRVESALDHEAIIFDDEKDART
jgi:hypothetical protein